MINFLRVSNMKFFTNPSQILPFYGFMKYGKRLKGSSIQYAELAIKNVNTAQDFLPAIRSLMDERRERLLNG